MKIGAGAARGRNIVVPGGGRLRVTTDRVKEALFNILGSLEGCRFLDIFAGSGSVGIEALSRGAGNAVFIENNPRHVKTIKDNLLRCGFASGYEILAISCDKGLAALSDGKRMFDVVFADPPYEKGLVAKSLERIGAAGIIEPGGIVIVEHSVRECCAGGEGLVLEDQRRYGDTVLSFLAPQ